VSKTFFQTTNLPDGTKVPEFGRTETWAEFLKDKSMPYFNQVDREGNKRFQIPQDDGRSMEAKGLIPAGGGGMSCK
jgi:hypothetical protein